MNFFPVTLMFNYPITQKCYKKAHYLANSGLLVGEGGFEPPKSVTTDLQSAPFGRSGIPPYKILELVDGFEPPTC